MGTSFNMHYHVDHRYIRKDSTVLHNTIERVRTWIFDKGFPVDGAAVERVLKPESLVLTRVSCQLVRLIIRNILYHLNPEHLFKTA
jgi:hypothetical protein